MIFLSCYTIDNGAYHIVLISHFHSSNDTHYVCLLVDIDVSSLISLQLHSDYMILGTLVISREKRLVSQLYMHYATLRSPHLDNYC